MNNRRRNLGKDLKKIILEEETDLLTPTMEQTLTIMEI